MPTTSDPSDPRLTHYTGPEEPAPQAEMYLVLSEEERAKGFVRPVRRSYIHVGPPGPKYPLADLTPEQQERYGDKYIKYEEYPEGSHALGRYWTTAQLEEIGAGCKALTSMGVDLAESYARNPHFYGATYCVHCSAHFPIADFVWDDMDERLGT